MVAEKVHNGFIVKEILIPKINQYPFEKADEWGKRGLAKALARVDKRRAEKITADLPIETAAHCEKMTFGDYRLTGPASGRDKSPLDVVLDCLEPHIIQGKWGKFRREFTRQLTLSFTAICNSDYNQVRVNQMNDSINQLLREFIIHPAPIHRGEARLYGRLEFVLHPETAESYSSPDMFKLRSLIWEHFGIRLDPSQYQISSELIPGRPRQMDMHLALSL